MITKQELRQLVPETGCVEITYPSGNVAVCSKLADGVYAWKITTPDEKVTSKIFVDTPNNYWHTGEMIGIAMFPNKRLSVVMHAVLNTDVTDQEVKVRKK